MRGRPGLRRAPAAAEEPPRRGPAAPSGGQAMLPWKRHKFELLAAAAAAEEPPPPQQAGPAAKGSCPAGGGGGGSLPCSAALGSLARACPPESALGRLGRLLGGKRQSFRVSREAPSYTVLYLGNAPTLQAKGEGCTEAAVGRIWAKSEAGRRGAKMKLSVGPQGLRLAPAAGDAARPGHLYLLHRVTYCAADPRLPRLFAWVYRHEGKHKAVLLRCHAALLSRAEKARALALLLYQTSAAALADFRRLKKRADARRQQLQQAGPGADGAVPLVPPLRQLLLRGPAGCYKPPVERSRSAPRLGSITEDARGEELEERADGRPHHRADPDDERPEEEEQEQRRLRPGPGRDEAPGLGQLISDLGQLALGNPPDLPVSRLLSGQSPATPPLRLDGGRRNPQPDTG